ncbi:SGNH/GDSL hydrolase family protein [Gramella sp. AN32]|uniref:SGNH/GDSL hydrolase family protein n=1 Tax=Christiangramia antarctica TaxID=2058158 RepID=A0ABW5X6N2_9FLAO|nr:SGNH/GDSL hydrolase family protein [Gramella sp. AN32]MCM4154659.1 lysophospholipase [Gramella sp. AN32]
MKKIYLLIFSIIIASCSSTQDTNTTPELENPKYSYLALGDSYTIGESVPEAERWPVQLTQHLRDRGFEMAAPKIIAKTGWTTGNLIYAIDEELNVQKDFDIVSILIGVNNQYQGKPVSEYEADLRKIFNRAVNHSKNLEKGVFAVSIPDYGYTPFGESRQEEISAEIDQFNEVFRRIAGEFNVDFYNITPISRQGLENPDLVASDNLHPSGLQYRYWVDEIVTEVAAKLSN